MDTTKAAALLDLQSKLIERGLPARLARAAALSAIDRVGSVATETLATEFLPAGAEGAEGDTEAEQLRRDLEKMREIERETRENTRLERENRERNQRLAFQ
jgi:poly-gamma-glutamate capsule biosynthesis protein CapA/YwtB (metallophosphatase superfamily)